MEILLWQEKWMSVRRDQCNACSSQNIEYQCRQYIKLYLKKVSVDRFKGRK